MLYLGKSWEILWDLPEINQRASGAWIECRTSFSLVPAGRLSSFPRARSWCWKGTDLRQPGSAVGKTMVASSLTDQSKGQKEIVSRERGGREGRRRQTGKERRSEPLVEACGRKPANSFPAREDLDISRHERHPVYLILPKRLDRDIPERGKGQGRRKD